MAFGLPRTFARAARRAFGKQAAVAGVSRKITGNGAGQFKVRIDIKDMDVAVVNGTEFNAIKLLDFPAGRIQIIGGVASLAFAVTTARASTINDNAAMDWSVGTTAAANVTLDGTAANIVAKQDKALDGAVAAFTTAQGADVAATAFYDGTGTAADAYLNISFPTTTDVDGNGTLRVTGFIELLCANMGDR
jgi:hypothetical protein